MKICVFGASCPAGEAYEKAVRELGRKLGADGHTLVFGGYSKSLMKAIADGFMDAGADIIGVVPDFFEDHLIKHEGCMQVIHTKELSDRKEKMIALADGFIAVPGGTGTLDELFDVLAMKQTGRLSSPVVLYNPFGYWDALTAALEKMQKQGFILHDLQELYRCTDSKEEIVKLFQESSGGGKKWQR